MMLSADLPYASVYSITYRQKQVLKRTLDGLFQQNYPSDRYEIVVLDDGSNDGTLELLEALALQSPVPLKIISVPHEADYLSAKRFNQCVSAAAPRASVFVHIEDAVVRPDFVWQHVKWHIQPTAVLVSGAMFEGDTVTWELEACDPDRRYLSLDGRPVECDFQAVWAKSMSFSRAMMSKVWQEPFDRPFDERMTGWGYHEIEFALRMLRAGARMVYDPAAGVFHPRHTPVTEGNRGFDRETLVREGEEKNIDYLCRKHSLDGLDDWSDPRPIEWIDRAIWACAAQLLRAVT